MGRPRKELPDKANLGYVKFYDDKIDRNSSHHCGAIFADNDRHRLRLWRIWDEDFPLMWFIGLNPSTADAQQDDPTIKRCMNFAYANDCGGIQMVNLFTFRATDPDEMYAQDPDERNILGADDELKLCAAAGRSYAIAVAAWGAAAALPDVLNRVNEIKPFFAPGSLLCFSKTKHGHPRHPLYLKGDTELEVWL